MRHTHPFNLAASILGLILVVRLGLAAEPGFSGNWKLNLEKSQLAGQTFVLEKTASGMTHFEMSGWTYDFNPDGKEYPVPDGSKVTVRPLDDSNWDWVFTMGGKETMRLHSKLQGESVTFVMHTLKPDGSAVEQTSTATRVSGGPGLLGKWRSKEVKGAPTSMVITTKGKKGVTMTYPEFQQVCEGQFDGKDYKVMQAGVASKVALVFEKTGANSFTVTTKLQGKPVYKDVLTLSADAKTLVDEGNSLTANEPVKSVYERQ
jgi:hypothetical protein